MVKRFNSRANLIDGDDDGDADGASRRSFDDGSEDGEGEGEECVEDGFVTGLSGGEEGVIILATEVEWMAAGCVAFGRSAMSAGTRSARGVTVNTVGGDISDWSSCFALSAGVLDSCKVVEEDGRDADEVKAGSGAEAEAESEDG